MHWSVLIIPQQQEPWKGKIVRIFFNYDAILDGFFTTSHEMSLSIILFKACPCLPCNSGRWYRGGSVVKPFSLNQQAQELLNIDNPCVFWIFFQDVPLINHLNPEGGWFNRPFVSIDEGLGRCGFG